MTAPLDLHPVQVAELETLRWALDSGFVTDWSLAVDGGAHFGGWSALMVERFESVLAFEPAPDTFLRLVANMAGFENVSLYNMALMDHRQMVSIGRMHRAMTGRFIIRGGGDVLAVALDEMSLENCGMIKLDLEGCEFLALKGARRTIERHRPFIIVEEAGLCARFGVDEGEVSKWLETAGYRQAFHLGVDVGYIPQ